MRYCAKRGSITACSSRSLRLRCRRAIAAWTLWVTERSRDGHEIADPRAEGIARAAALEDDAARVAALVALLGVEGETTDELVSKVAAEEKRLPRG